MVKARSPAVDARIFTNMYICMICNARNRTQKPSKTRCRKCGSKDIRLKNKQVKSAV